MKKYIGKELPSHIKEPVSPEPSPATAPKLTPRQARKVIGLNGTEPYERAFPRYRKAYLALQGQGDEGKLELVQLNAAWEVLCVENGWL